MLYKTDYHIHSTFSDGKAAPEDYISNAIDAGLKEIGFSEHLNLMFENQEWCMDVSRVPEYIAHIRAIGKNENNIKVRLGLEVDYFPGKEKEISEFIGHLDLDYVIGSIHYIGETTVDSGPEYYEHKDIDKIYGDYFEHVNRAVESGLFDIVAHCDLVRIFNFLPSGDTEHYYRKLAGVMSLHDVAIEINTNGRNRPLGDFYPDRRFISLFREKNVPVCVNSDAHFPARVGQYFEEAYLLLKDAGYREMVVFEKRKKSVVPAGF